MVNANLLLGLAATVAVTSTLLSVVALLWVTSAAEPSRLHPTGDDL